MHHRAGFSNLFPKSLDSSASIKSNQRVSRSLFTQNQGSSVPTHEVLAWCSPVPSFNVPHSSPNRQNPDRRTQIRDIRKQWSQVSSCKAEYYILDSKYRSSIEQYLLTTFTFWQQCMFLPVLTLHRKNTTVQCNNLIEHSKPQGITPTPRCNPATPSSLDFSPLVFDLDKVKSRCLQFDPWEFTKTKAKQSINDRKTQQSLSRSLTCVMPPDWPSSAYPC